VTACVVTRSNNGIDDLAAVDTRHQAHDGSLCGAAVAKSLLCLMPHRNELGGLRPPRGGTTGTIAGILERCARRRALAVKRIRGAP
jgi:hypothetical protein